MPTYDELNELRTKCTWTWTTQNGVNGCNVEGPNGNSIFLPAAGYRNGSLLNIAGIYGGFWSSALCRYDEYNDFCAYEHAYLLGFGIDYLHMNVDNRFDGLSVRPVLE